jgi:hypothetical protein
MKADDGTPAPLHAVARDLLAEFRELEDMPADARARVRRSLEADDAPQREAVGSAGARSWIMWSLVGAAAGVALLLGLEAIVPMLSTEREAPRLEAAPDRADRGDASSRANVRDDAATRDRGARREPDEVLAPAPVEVVVPAPDDPTSNREAAGRASPPRRDPPPRDAAPSDPVEPPAATASTLDAERRLVAQAWSALTEGDPGAALATAAAHRERFPNGALVPERFAVEAIARCKRDGDDSRARAFLNTHARSPLAARVRSACAITSPTAGSTTERTPTGR